MHRVSSFTKRKRKKKKCARVSVCAYLCVVVCGGCVWWRVVVCGVWCVMAVVCVRVCVVCSDGGVWACVCVCVWGGH